MKNWWALWCTERIHDVQCPDRSSLGCSDTTTSSIYHMELITQRETTSESVNVICGYGENKVRRERKRFTREVCLTNRPPLTAVVSIQAHPEMIVAFGTTSRRSWWISTPFWINTKASVHFSKGPRSLGVGKTSGNVLSYVIVRGKDPSQDQSKLRRQLISLEATDYIVIL